MPMGPMTRTSLIDRLRRAFGGAPPHVQAAALPYRRTSHGVEILLVSSRDSGRWILPKGWPEGDEELSEAAEREAAEEAGVAGRVWSREAGCYYYGKAMRSGLQRRCEVHVYPLQVERLAKKWPEKKLRRRTWLDPRDAAALVEERDLARLLKGFQP